MLNRKRLVMVATLALLASLVPPVYAKKSEATYTATGTIDSYADAWSSEIISGQWSVKVKGDDLDFRGMYRELNLDEIEDSPVGSVDIFTMTFTEDGFELNDDTLIFWGTVHVRKVWVTMDWTREIVTWDGQVSVTITPETFYMDALPWGPGPGTLGQDWDRLGTTRQFNGQELDMELECILPYRRYYVFDPDTVEYQLYSRVRVYSEDGADDITSVEMNTPSGDTLPMEYIDSYESDTYSIYTVRWDTTERVFGEYTYVATDRHGNTAIASYDLQTWIDVVPVSVTPGTGETLPYGEPIEWEITWGPDEPEIEMYQVALGYEDECIWWGELPDQPLIYDGEQPGTGGYGFEIFVITNQGEVYINGYFFIE